VFRSVYLKTLRDMRWGALGWGVGIGLLVAVTAAAWAAAYPDETSRSQLAAQLHGGLSAAQVMYGPPRHVDELGGFIEWRVLGLAPVLLGLYLILAATGMTRGAEDSRAIEVVVATPRTRSRVLLEQAGALATGIAAAMAVVGLFTLTTGVLAREHAPGALRIAGACANVGVAALLFGAVGLCAAQFIAPRRAAALVSAGAMIGLHLVNTVPLVVPGLTGIRYASPLYLYTRSSPLSDGHMDWLAFAGLALASAVLTGLAFVASHRRDLFDTYHPRRRPRLTHEGRTTSGGTGAAKRQVFLRNSLGRGLGDAAGATLAWTAGLGLLAVLMTALTPNVREALLEQSRGPLFRQLERAGMLSERGILSALVFSFIPPLATVFSVTLAASWAADELNQRLELELAAPVPRWRVFAGRLAAAIVSQAAAITAMALAIVIAIKAEGIDVPVAAVGAASWTLVVLGACVVSCGFAVASWRPGLTAALAGSFVASSYFASLLIPLLGLPGWARYISVFGLYGSPLSDGVSYWRVAVLLGLTAALAVAGAAGFQRKDIAR
jgi:ABC-2 type transport system permease protein